MKRLFLAGIAVLSAALCTGCGKQPAPQTAATTPDDGLVVTAVDPNVTRGDPKRAPPGQPPKKGTELSPGKDREDPFAGLDPFRGRTDAPPNLPDPEEFFPTVVGSTSTYRITLGEVAPLVYRVTSYPLGGQRVSYAVRGLIGDVDARAGKSFTLVVGVERPAAVQGTTRYPRGVELSIRKDELGVFADCKKVFIAINRSRITAELVVTHTAESSHIPGTGEGESRKIMFFWESGKRLAISPAGSADRLLFTGIDSKVPDNSGVECLHFLRVVKGGEEEKGGKAEHLNQGFTEDLWYARDKGLVRLEQKIGGKTSMVWSLESYRLPGE